MDQPNALLQKRQFGRRETERHALATISGRAPLTCVIRNISEGGALIEFPEDTVPNRPFRLDIEGAPSTMLCEVRHHGRYGVGVRFLNAADGVHLMGHLYPGPALAIEAAGPSDAPPRPERPVMPAISNRRLRRLVLEAVARRLCELAEQHALNPPEKPIGQRFEEHLRHAFQAVVPGKRHVPEPDEEPDTAILAPPVPPEPPPPAPVQPRRSRKNGIKGKSAGGIG